MTRYLLPIVALGFAAPASGATPRYATAVDVTVAENVGSGLAPFAIKITKGASYAKVRAQTVDGTAKAGVDYRAFDTTVTLGNAAQTWSLPVAIINNSTFQGSRSFKVHLTCMRNCSLTKADGTISITDDDVGPIDPHTIPNPCGGMINGAPAPIPNSWCPARSCPGYPNPVSVEQPCPKVTAWTTAPLQVDGYARLKNGSDIIVHLLASGMTTDADPARRQHWWAVQFQQDSSGNFPASNPYWAALVGYQFDDSLEGVKPAP